LSGDPAVIVVPTASRPTATPPHCAFTLGSALAWEPT
jgi:hypothetical protein